MNAPSAVCRVRVEHVRVPDAMADHIDRGDVSDFGIHVCSAGSN